MTATLYTHDGCRKYLNAVERARFLDVAAGEPASIHALCQTLAHTGCRLSEALALTPRAIEADSGFVAIRSLKKRSRNFIIREVPVPPAMIEQIDRTFHLADHDPAARLWAMSRITAWSVVKD
ncbi:MAG TPA: site-specific integrase, partial [Hyphomicrobiaceae bacterium]|nr:site-specific integrase [Hyphomicrobiaceae bacterium]